MVSKLKQRRTRRLKSDVAWWMAEARDWKEIAMEHADEIDRLRNLVIRVPMPVIVPRDMAHQLYHTETKDVVPAMMVSVVDVHLAYSINNNRVQPGNSGGFMRTEFMKGTEVTGV